MNDKADKPGESTEPGADEQLDSGANAPSEEPKAQTSAPNGPTFTEAPDPLAGLRRWFGGVMDSMEGKTVSMKTYVSSIIGVIVLMMLARCGG